jgi:hypothetical protein
MLLKPGARCFLFLPWLRAEGAQWVLAGLPWPAGAADRVRAPGSGWRAAQAPVPSIG